MRPLHAFLLVCLAASPFASAQLPENSPGTPEQVRALIEQGRMAVITEKYADATKALEAALAMPVLETMSTDTQHSAFALAAYAASGQEDYLGAHEYIVAATQYDEATSLEWMLRAQFASWIDAWADAGLALTTVARRWPAEIRDSDDLGELVTSTVFRLRRDDSQRAQEIELLNALYAAEFKLKFRIEPDPLWIYLIDDALARNNLARAREVASRVQSNASVLSMRIDRRYDAIVRADPKRFDLAAVARRNSKVRARAVKDHPRSIGAFVQYGYALRDQGRHEQLLALTNDVFARIAQAPKDAPPYDDLDEKLNWVYEHKAVSLRALGRWEEMLAAMEEGRRTLEGGEANVSQAINLGDIYNSLGQPQKALDSLKDVDWNRGLSPFGRMQLQSVRYHAYKQLGNESEADNVYAYLRQNREEAPSAWLNAMLVSGDLDGAAAQLISQLLDPHERNAALNDVQDFRPLPPFPGKTTSTENWKKLLARADVAAAIDEVGRREKLPIYSALD